MSDILVTGFGPFGDHQTNPSWEAVKEIPNLWRRTENVTVLQVPVSYDYVKEDIPLLLDKMKPKFVLHVGVSGMEENTIHLETCAHSNGYSTLDIHGCCEPDNDDYECLKTCIDVESIARRCSDTFPIVKSSENAGRYLCEFIYYTSLRMQKELGRNVLFVHVPLLNDKLTVTNLAQCLVNILEYCLESL